MIGPGIQGLDPCPVCGELAELEHETCPDTGAEYPIACDNCQKSCRTVTAESTKAVADLLGWEVDADGCAIIPDDDPTVDDPPRED
jgi:hypothetical protein